MSETIFSTASTASTTLPRSESCEDLRALSESVSAASGLPLDFVYRDASQAGMSASAMWAASGPKMPTYHFQYALPKRRNPDLKGRCAQWWKVLTSKEKTEYVAQAAVQRQEEARQVMSEFQRSTEAAIGEKLNHPAYLSSLQQSVFQLSAAVQRVSAEYKADPYPERLEHLESMKATLCEQEAELQLAYAMQTERVLTEINARITDDEGSDDEELVEIGTSAHFKAPEDC